MVQRFEETGHPVFTGASSALNRGVMKGKNKKDTIHFNGESSNTELLFRISHSANQVCFYGAVTDWSQRLGRREAEREENCSQSTQNLNSRTLKSVDAQEVNSFLKESGKPQALGNRLREGLQGFQSLPLDKFSSNRSAKRLGFIVKWKEKIITRLLPTATMDPSQWVENTLHCSLTDGNSMCVAVIPGGTVLGPDLNEHVIKVVVRRRADQISLPGS